MWKYTTTKDCNQFLLSLNLLNCKNEKKYIRILYSISNNIDKNYKIYKIKKKNGKYRTIYEPSPILKNIQKRILTNILQNKNISTYAKAYKKGISLTDNARVHINKRIILKLDIEDFFSNINFYNVYTTCFQLEYFPKSVGMLLTHLCTYNGYLPQGAKTSPYISNLVMKEFDEAIGKYTKENNIDYTRYSDDLTFSGDFNIKEVINKVNKLLYYLGLKLNKDKIHVITSSQNQSVTGITVNKKMQVNVKYRKKIRQEIYYIKKFGLKSHLINQNVSDEKNIYKNYMEKLTLYYK